MAKKTKEVSSDESGFDFSRFLDLDDEVVVELDSPTDDGYQTIPHSRAEIATGGLDANLEEAVENYIKAGGVSWGDKRILRKLVSDNRELEDTVRDTDTEIISRANDYHGVLSAILQKKGENEGYALDDSDPYDAEATGFIAQSQGVHREQAQSSDIYKEIDKLESHRSRLNAKRLGILEDVRKIAGADANDEIDDLKEMVDLKISSIIAVQDITKVKFTDDDEEIFEQGVDELTGYIKGDFNPLAEDDEYDEDEDGPLVVELDGAEGFSSAESPAGLLESLGDDSFEATAQSADEDIAESDIDIELEEEIAVEGDLSDRAHELTEYIEPVAPVAEDASLDEGDDDADLSVSENSWATAIHPNFVAIDPLDPSREAVRPVIFEALQEKYGITFSFDEVEKLKD